MRGGLGAWPPLDISRARFTSYVKSAQGHRNVLRASIREFSPKSAYTKVTGAVWTIRSRSAAFRSRSALTSIVQASVFYMNLQSIFKTDNKRTNRQFKQRGQTLGNPQCDRGSF